jgi:hypothetical protein
MTNHNPNFFLMSTNVVFNYLLLTLPPEISAFCFLRFATVGSHFCDCLDAYSRHHDYFCDIAVCTFAQPLDDLNLPASALTSKGRQEQILSLRARKTARRYDRILATQTVRTRAPACSVQRALRDMFVSMLEFEEYYLLSTSQYTAGNRANF